MPSPTEPKGGCRWRRSIACSGQFICQSYAAGCQTINIYPYREAAADFPRAVVGLTDISARTYIRQQLRNYLVTLVMPLKMSQEMEGDVKDSLLERPVWEKFGEGEAGRSLE